MRITVFNGSPRAEKGNTNIMVQDFLAGAKDAGAEVENIFLAGKNIKPCLGEFECWIKTPGECIIKDDMEELLPKFISSDIVVFATPVYVDNVTGIMKNFMDRLLPIIDPHFEKDENGEYRHTPRYKKTPKIVVVSNCGFPEQSHFQVLRLLFRRVARNIHSEVIGEIYRGEGELLRHPPQVLKHVIQEYKHLLRKAGREVVEDLRLSEKTRLQLEEPLISYDKYIFGANKHWDSKLGKLKSATDNE
ncbi:flavodoxin family protein [Candidatus Sumerlaeota bacterium]|nr:flavodoxin family protein [Candidatus Sumerlaeota bacterium]